VGYVELDENGSVVFVFPEQVAEDGSPKRMPWWEAAETDLMLQRLATPERCHEHALTPPG